jgi:predicted ATP-grasp superfamily ATP-dependent carboligase
MRVDGAGALVIGGDHQGLGIARSLGRRGIGVAVADDEISVGVASRFIQRRFPWPSSEAQQIESLADNHGLRGATIYPTRDETVALLAQRHERLRERFVLVTPPWEVTRWAYDKRLTYELAGRIGLACPGTHYPRGREEVEGLDLLFPVIIKPAIKDHFYSQTLTKAWEVTDRAELLDRYDEAMRLIPGDEIMIQEVVPGGGETQVSFAALCADGDVLAWVTARRTRQHPMDYGHSSTFVETIDCAPIEEPSRELLAAMRYSGLVEVEYKHDTRDDRYKVLDVNARTWGWHTIGRRAGVDFPYLAWRLAHGEPVPRRQGRNGVRWMRGVTDVPTALREIRGGRLTVGAYLRSFRAPLELSVLAVDDPLPSLAELALLPYTFWKRGF